MDAIKLDRVTEILFLIALTKEGTDVTQRVTERVLDYVENPPNNIRLYQEQKTKDLNI